MISWPDPTTYQIEAVVKLSTPKDPVDTVIQICLK